MAACVYSYHRLLGAGMRLNLAAVKVLVSTESSILSESPRVDILLLRREGAAWIEAQRERLPDGIGDSSAGHILIEFKYTESVSEDGILQAAAYDLFYRQVQRLSKEDTTARCAERQDASEEQIGQVGVRRSAEWCLSNQSSVCGTCDAFGTPTGCRQVQTMPLLSYLPVDSRRETQDSPRWIVRCLRIRRTCTPMSLV